ncbi:MAG: MerR family transcriptional regulator [Candidatus Puniceispirillum sp.]
MYKISQAAKSAGLPVKTVRYYANIGLVKPSSRSDAGYRLYSPLDIAKLEFIGRARRFSFSIEQCRDLLGLYENRARPSAEVKRITLEKVAELHTLRDTLLGLAESCHGDSRPDCPIIGALAGAG